MSEALFAEFPPVTTADWEAAIVRDLKGADPKKLVWKTEDGFEVKPFYRMEDATGQPAFVDFPKSWRICSEVDGPDAAAEVIARGAQAILLHTADTAKLEAVLERIASNPVEVHVRAGGAASSLLMALRKYKGKLRGSIDAPTPAEGYGAEGVAFAIDGDLVARLEPTSTQELALMLALGSEYLAAAGAGIANHIAFDFPVGANYFFEIAKLRAARLLWPAIVRAYSPTARPVVRIFAHTGGWSKSI